jgi:Spy/CpxP family protein refolding chaperone
MKFAALATSIFLAVPLFAQPGDGGPGEEPGCPRHEEMRKKFEQELNLTEEQKQKLAALREEGAEARKQHKEKMHQVRQSMKDELAKEKPDGTKLMEYATQTSDLVEQMTKNRIDHLLKMKVILTKDQFEKMLNQEWHGPKECKKEEHQKHGKRHGKSD